MELELKQDELGGGSEKQIWRSVGDGSREDWSPQQVSAAEMGVRLELGLEERER